MNIGFLINQTHKEKSCYTTTSLAWNALRRAHPIYYIGLADFFYEQGSLYAHVRAVGPTANIADVEQLIDYLKHSEKTIIALADLDVLWLRYDPVLDMYQRPWAIEAGLQFANIAQQQGLLVVNNPAVLIQAPNKVYLEELDLSLRPRTLITRSYQDVLTFMHQEQHQVVLKPLRGSGGRNVFVLRPHQTSNVKQIVESICRDGYLIAQSYLKDAHQGDVRVFMVEGEPLVTDGVMACVRRVPQGEEQRSNVQQGGTVVPATLSPAMAAVVQRVGAKMHADGMFFVGLDLVGDQILEINVFSPGVLTYAEELLDRNFSAAIISSLETLVLRHRPPHR